MAYYIAEGAVVKGQVTMADGASVWYNATVRGDSEPIEIGRNSNIQDNAVVHVDLSHSVIIGDNVTIGHSAIVHGCTIGDNTLIGMGAIVLNGARIGKKLHNRCGRSCHPRAPIFLTEALHLVLRQR